MAFEDIFGKVCLPDTVIEDVIPVEADAVEKGIGAFLQVKLCSRPAAGSLIYSEVWLPKEWNGIYVGTGNNGMAGEILYESLRHYVKYGYAVANTDLGTSRDWRSGVNNPDVLKDFGWRATYLMTVCAKELVRAYYGEEARYSYFSGHSCGGMQALSMAQRFPEEYDGIIAGAPAHNRTHMHNYLVWNYICLHPENGHALFTKDEVRAVADCAVELYRALGDGEVGDDFVSLPRADALAVEEMVRLVGMRNPTFTQQQLDALRKVYTGPINPRTGKRIHCGMPIGAENNGVAGLIWGTMAPVPSLYPIRWALGETFNGYRYDFDRDLETVDRIVGAEINANKADLSAFRDHGGKLLMYSGSGDPMVPHPEAMHYINRVAVQEGGFRAAMEFARWFLIPGKDHGTGGGTQAVRSSAEGGELLDALRRWREEGIAPEALWAESWTGKKRENGIRFMRRVPVYNGMNCGLTPPACDESYL